MQEDTKHKPIYYKKIQIYTTESTLIIRIESVNYILLKIQKIQHFLLLKT